MRQKALATLFLHDRETPVADLVYDSLLDEPPTDQPGERTLRFAAVDGSSVTVRVSPQKSGLDVQLQVAPPAQYAIAVHRKAMRPLLLDSDSSGHARIPGVRGGLMSFRFLPAGGTPTDARRTAWVVY